MYGNADQYADQAIRRSVQGDEADDEIAETDGPQDEKKRVPLRAADHFGNDQNNDRNRGKEETFPRER